MNETALSRQTTNHEIDSQDRNMICIGGKKRRDATGHYRDNHSKGGHWRVSYSSIITQISVCIIMPSV